MTYLPALNIEDFPHKTYDKLRFGDTDATGFIHPSELLTFIDTGRDALTLVDTKLLKPNAAFVVANVDVTLLKPMHWPGVIEIGTVVTKIGNTSILFFQRLFQNNSCVAYSTSTLVQMDNASHKSTPLTEDARTQLLNYLRTMPSPPEVSSLVNRKETKQTMVIANDLNLSDFPHRTHDKIRFGDTDALGHVNNAAFSTFLESGRAELLLSDEALADEHCTFVIVNLNLNFIAEINWPGTVDIGTAVQKIGTSSVTFYQRIYQNGILVADAETTAVQMHEVTRRSSPLTENAKIRLSNYALSKL